MQGRELSSTAELRKVLEEARTVAVLGAHTSPEKPACYVPDYLAGQEKQYVARVLHAAGGDKAKAAKALGVDVSRL